eukprot:2140016-Prymnesium_polylepis.1
MDIHPLSVPTPPLGVSTPTLNPPVGVPTLAQEHWVDRLEWVDPPWWFDPQPVWVDLPDWVDPLGVDRPAPVV